MNKVIYICVAATMALASCSNDEVVEQAKENAISFRSVVGMNTKGTEATTNDLSAINVTAYQESTVYFDNIKYEKDGTGFFNSVDPYYWPEKGELTFTALSDNWSGTREFTSSTNQWMHSVTIEQEIADQKDMVYVTGAVGSKATNEKSGLPLTFKHALAQIQINAKNGNGNYIYKVKGIRINNVYNGAEFDLTKEEWWTNGAEVYYETTYNDPIDLTNDAKSIMGAAGNALMIPFSYHKYEMWDGKTLPNKDGFDVPLSLLYHEGSNIGTFISVLVNIQTRTSAQIYPNKANGYAWTAVPAKFEWAKGYKYTYTLDFTSGAGKVDPSDPGTDWDETKDPAKAEQILGGAITFETEVSGWTETSNDIDLD